MKINSFIAILITLYLLIFYGCDKSKPIELLSSERGLIYTGQNKKLLDSILMPGDHLIKFEDSLIVYYVDPKERHFEIKDIQLTDTLFSEAEIIIVYYINETRLYNIEFNYGNTIYETQCMPELISILRKNYSKLDYNSIVEKEDSLENILITQLEKRLDSNIFVQKIVVKQ